MDCLWDIISFLISSLVIEPYVLFDRFDKFDKSLIV